MTGRDIAIAIGALGLTLLTSCATLAQVGSANAAAVAWQLFPANGKARGRAIQAVYARTLQETGDPLAAASPQVLAQAKAAYVREPLQPDVVAVLASPLLARRDPAAIALLSAGHGFTRRSTLLNSQLLAAFAETGEMRPAFALVDEILRRETAAQGPILDNLARFAGNPAHAETILGLLDMRVPWAPQFWRQVSQSPVALANAANLRIAHDRRGGLRDPEIDRMMVNGLAGQARFDDAARLARALFSSTTGGRLGADGNLLANGTFAAQPNLLPFDWELTGSGDHSAQIMDQQQLLSISALPGVRAVVARQLVAMPSGASSVAVRASASAAGGERALKARLVCAEAGGRTLLSANAIGLSTRVAGANCPWAWFQLEVEVPSDESGQDWSVRQIVLRPTA